MVGDQSAREADGDRLSGRKIAIRADYGWSVGAGHLMRCLALAQALKSEGMQSHFLLDQTSGGAPERLRREGFGLIELDAVSGSIDDAEATANWTWEHGAEWLVLDGYRFGDAYEAAVRSAVPRMLALDDHGHAKHSLVDVIVNQNHGATTEQYVAKGFRGVALCGCRYAMLRSEFLVHRDWSRKVAPTCRNALIAFGGSDPMNCTACALEALLDPRLAGLKAIALCGNNNPRMDELHALARELTGRVELLDNSDDMPRLMMAADVAIGAAGATTWERAFLGLPTLAFVLAPNQAIIGEAIANERIGEVIANPGNVSSREIADLLFGICSKQRLRTEMARRGQALIDGRGAGRVARRMLEMAA